MSKEDIKKFVNSVVDNDNIQAQKDFAAAVSTKIGSAIDAQKQEVARSMFTGQVGVDAPEANVFSGNNIEGSTDGQDVQ